MSVKPQVFFSSFEKKQRTSLISIPLKSDLVLHTRNKQLFEVMQKEIRIPMTKIR